MTIDTTATPLGANPSTDQHPATAPGQGIVHLCHRTRGTAAPVADTLGPPDAPDHTERASTNNDNDGHER